MILEDERYLYYTTGGASIMNDQYTLNILNGQSMHHYFKQHYFDEEGVYVPFNEAMCVGEVTFNNFYKEVSYGFN